MTSPPALVAANEQSAIRAAARIAEYSASWADRPSREAAEHFRCTTATIRRWRHLLGLPVHILPESSRQFAGSKPAESDELWPAIRRQ